MTESPASSSSLISFHRLALRPGARLADVRLLTTDRRRLHHDHPSLRHVDTLVCGARSSLSMRIPPSIGDRQVVAVWGDLAAYQEFSSGPVMARWRRSAEVFSALAQPFAARGDWPRRNPLADIPSTGSVDGPLMVLTHAWVPARHLLRWHGRVVPRGVADFPTASGLLGVSVAANPTSQRAQTVTFWTDTRSMIDAVYRRESAHGSQLAWGKDNLRNTWFARARLISAEGTWLGRNPLAEVLAEGAR